MYGGEVAKMEEQSSACGLVRGRAGELDDLMPVTGMRVEVNSGIDCCPVCSSAASWSPYRGRPPCAHTPQRAA